MKWKKFSNRTIPLRSIRDADAKERMLFTRANTHDVKVENEAAVKAMNRLLKIRISCNWENDTTIYFQNWAMLEEDRGIAYSLQEEDQPVLAFLTEFER